MTGTAAALPAWLGLAAFAAAAVVSYGSILLLWPWLQRYALARPNARSSHKTPTPQGGGIAVVGATLLVMVVAFAMRPGWGGAQSTQLAAVIAGALLMTIMGAIDDVRALDPLTRLGLQSAGVALVIAVMPAELRAVPWLPWWVERIALLAAGVWFVNLVNFMDGIDWMTVAQVVPMTTGLVIAGVLGGLPPLGILAACALAGAVIGFAPFNRPVAKLFLGDVGSVPIGLILAWLLFLLASHGRLAAALLLSLYYVADATLTLALRMVRGEKVWEAHRTHFYQRATTNGMSVSGIVARVFAVNLALVFLATTTLAYPSMTTDVVSMLIGAALVAALLVELSRHGQRAPE